MKTFYLPPQIGLESVKGVLLWLCCILFICAGIGSVIFLVKLLKKFSKKDRRNLVIGFLSFALLMFSGIMIMETRGSSWIGWIFFIAGLYLSYRTFFP